MAPTAMAPAATGAAARRCTRPPPRCDRSPDRVPRQSPGCAGSMPARPQGWPAVPDLQSPRADDGRAPRGIPVLLRGEGASALPVVLPDPARGRPLDAADERRDAAADALLPRARAAAGAADDDRAEGLPDGRHRRGR